MGFNAKLTQASRDGGVDCVADGERPIYGGKVVIQAKHFRSTVGVGPVRELYGTTQNEGASKGILITTSKYSKSAHDFARGKPLELFTGAHLLHLLEEKASIQARIVMPDGATTGVPSPLPPPSTLKTSNQHRPFPAPASG